jgi:MFS family permease
MLNDSIVLLPSILSQPSPLRPDVSHSPHSKMQAPSRLTVGKEPISNDDEIHSGANHEPNAEDIIDKDAQLGIQQIEAVTSVWTKTALVAAYIMIWITYFVEGLVSGTSTSLLPYVVSAYASHSLTPTVTVVSSVIGGCTNFTIAKILDVFGRPQGYLICIVIATVGLIMMGACRTVEMYAAAQVFYTVGNTGLQYSLSVFVADTSSLQNRGLMQAFAYSPNMITCWLGGPISTAFLSGAGWPLAYGMFSILVPAVTLPLYGLLQWHYLKAKKQGLVPKRASGRSIPQSIIHHSREFDAIGLILLSAGVTLFLLPFNLYTLQTKGWDSPLIICLLVFGVVLLGLFVVWEKLFAPVTFIPYSLLTDRTVIGACILSATLYFSYYCWYSYFSSFLQIVNDLSVTEASYVVQTYTVGSVLFGFLAGILIHYTGRYKPVCLYGGIPLNILGTGLMMYFRRPNSHVGYIVMCQIFISLAAGIVIIADEIAMLAAASHQHIAVALATLGFFGNIGGSIGLTITAAIWENTFAKKLAEYLPASELPNLLTIYGDLTTQLSYPVGSEARTAIQRAYGDGQTNILIAATAVWVLGAAGVLIMRNIDVSKIKQVKGHVV